MLTRRALLHYATLAASAALAGPIAWRGARATAVKPSVALFKNPGCGCCEDYAAYLRQHGFTVTVKETEKLAAMSTEPRRVSRRRFCLSQAAMA